MALKADALSLYERWRVPGTPSALLESARSGRSGRWSFVGIRPSLILRAQGGRTRFDAPFGGRTLSEGDPFEALRGALRSRASAPRPGLPPFTGGAVGLVSYGAKRFIEPRLDGGAADDAGLPEAYFLFFDEGAAFDAATGGAWLFSRGPEASAKRRLDALERSVRAALRRRPRRRAAPRSDGALEGGLPRAEFARKVRQIQRFIRSGDIFQANLSQRFWFRAPAEATALYRRLRDVNPSPFFGLLDGVDFQVISGSPERLVKLEGGTLETRPIAGTRPRGRAAVADRRLGAELLLNEKERAEHVMLVDLERNDLGRVCEYGSVAVDELMAIEDYSHVKHIVSNVRGRLKRGADAVDVLKALFPGGTITGAPKIRCVEILDALEPVARGPYTGSLGYVSDTGNMDFNILIRGLVLKGRTAYLQAGAGIVADSDPDKEYDETLYKAQGVLAAVFGEARARRFLRSRGVAARVS